MSTFVLVHGAWHGSWCWKRVRRLLQERGHDVFTPTLTGLADRSHLLTRGVNLETHIQDVANLILWEELSGVILCGHSYGGAVVEGVADRLPERIRALVYLDAFVLESGECVLEHVPGALAEGAGAGEEWKVPPIPGEVFGVNAQDLEWMKRQCTVHPMAAFEQKLELTGGIDRVGNVTPHQASVGFP